MNFTALLVGVFGLLLIHGVSAQSEFDDTDLNALIAVLNQLNIKEICAVIKDITRDDLCFKQLQVACQNERFLTRMTDANSKFPYTGMLVKTKLDLGSFDECIELDVTSNDVRVLGKYCLAGLIIPTSNGSDAIEQAYKLSTCIPNGCTAMELLTLANSTELYPLFNDFSCSTKEKSGTIGWDYYVVITYFILVFMLLIVATIYDLYFYYANIECPNILLRAFSVIYNGRKLFTVSKATSQEIKVIHGLRVFSLLWIILGHEFANMAVYPGINADFPIMFERSRKSFYVSAAYLGVDTFFFISGFLLAYQYLKQKPTSLLNHLKRIPMMIFHRYARLTPVAASLFIITTSLLVHMGDGPFYYALTKVEQDRCLNNWWAYFTYLQNYVNYDDICLLNTWYLSADWQLFLISPIILIPVAMLVKKHFKWVMIQLLILNLLFTFLPFGLKLLLKDFDNEYDTHSRLNDYFIGFMLGVFMRERNDNKFRMSRKMNVLIWLSVLTTMAITVLLYKEIQLLVLFQQDKSFFAYFILLRFFWCIGLTWVIYACHNGYGGFINWVCTTPLMQVLSRLTFCMYLVHMWPVAYFLVILRTPIELSQLTGLKMTVVAYVVTVIMSIGTTFAFESPLITIEKYLMSPRK